MINLFFYNNKWEIATKSVIGANCKYYLHKIKTYRDMFFEVINHLNINLDDGSEKKLYDFVEFFDSILNANSSGSFM